MRSKDTEGSVYYVVNYNHASHPSTREEFDTLEEAMAFHDKMSADSWCSSSSVLCVEVMSQYQQRSKFLERRNRRLRFS